MISIYDWFGYDVPIAERYRYIKNAGFDGVMLWWSDGFGRGEYHKGIDHARNVGLNIDNIHTPIQNQNDLWKDDLDGQHVLNTYIQCVSDCAQYSIPTMVIHLPEEQYPYSATSLDKIKLIADKAEKYQINVAMENVRNFSNLKYVLDSIQSERIGFCYDCCHHYNYRPNTDLLSMYGNRLMAIHLICMIMAVNADNISCLLTVILTGRL